MRTRDALNACLLAVGLAACGGGPGQTPPADDEADLLLEEKSPAELAIEAEPLPPPEPVEAATLGQGGDLRRLCFSPAEDCLARLLRHARAETRGIDVAIYHLRDRRLSRLLVEKARAGVEVRVLADRHAYATSRAQRAEVDYLVARGVPVRTNRFRGILHHKYTLLRGQRLVAQGSMNYSAVASRKVNGRWNDEITFFTTNRRVAARYGERFDRAWAAAGRGARPYQTMTVGADLPSFEEAEAARPRTCYENPSPDPRPRPDDRALRVCFAPDEHCTRDRVRPLVRAERSRIDVIAFRITTSHLTGLLLAKARAGVRVRLIFDRAQYYNPGYPTMRRFVDDLAALARAGHDVRLKATAHRGSMHAKAIVTSSAATWGSGNYTSSSSKRVRGCQSQFYQTEDSILTTDASLVRRMQERFDAMWGSRDFADFRP